MIRYEKNQIILSGKTAKSFVDKLNNPNKETVMNRRKYFETLKNELKVTKTADGRIFLK